MVEEHFKNIEVTPLSEYSCNHVVVEEHFKNMEVTPIARKYYKSFWVEEHFKNIEATPIRTILNIGTDNVGKTYYDKVEEHFNT